jgi:hypothetical protein
MLHCMPHCRCTERIPVLLAAVAVLARDLRGGEARVRRSPSIPRPPGLRSRCLQSAGWPTPAAHPETDHRDSWIEARVCSIPLIPLGLEKVHRTANHKPKFDLLAARHHITNLENVLEMRNPGALQDLQAHLSATATSMRHFKAVLLDALRVGDPRVVRGGAPKFPTWHSGGTDAQLLADVKDLVHEMAEATGRKLYWSGEEDHHTAAVSPHTTLPTHHTAHTTHSEGRRARYAPDHLRSLPLLSLRRPFPPLSLRRPPDPSHTG